MSKMRLLCFGWLLLASPAWAIDDPPPFVQAGATGIDMPPLNLSKIANEDQRAEAKDNPGGWRFAQAFEVEISPSTHGKWTRGKDGLMHWQYRVQADNAVHLNFGFTDYWLPEGAALEIASTDGQHRFRPFTSQDNERHRQLWTPPLPSLDITLRLRAPEAVYQQIALRLTRINQGYRGLNYAGKVCKSGSCNTDVACLGSNDPWNEPRRAVATIGFAGDRFCTGSLVNNTANNRRMLLATATHCGFNSNNDASIVVIWNYESPTCRRPGSAASGNPGGGSLLDFQTGGTLLAQTPDVTDFLAPLTSRSDWTLIELDDPADPSFNLYWAGWDRASAPPVCSVPPTANSTAGLCATIHHPSGDEKRITFSEQPMVEDDYESSDGQAQDVHWLVQWDSTPPVLPNISGGGGLPPSATEGGSSGSPLYNANRRMVGVLTGGASSCGVPTDALNDDYGKLAHAWEGRGTPTTRMRDYLDPTASGVTSLNGIGSCAAPTLVLNASTATPSVDAAVAFTLNITGGTGPYRVSWDVDDDGVTDRTATGVTSSTSLSPRYPTATTTNVRAQVTDALGCSTEAVRAINVSAPDIVVTESAPTQICGDNDAAIEPGERWNIPVAIRNLGGNTLDNGVAVFTPGPLIAEDGNPFIATADAFGYTRADNTGANASLCRFQAINMSAAQTFSPTASPNSSVAAIDDGFVANLALGPQPFNLYGQNISALTMSTNGYLATAADDGGGELSNSCGLYPTGPNNAYLQIQQDDLMLQTTGSLRRAYFSTCPRPGDVGNSSQGCTVFEWNNIGRWVANNQPPNGNAVLQAILYDQSYEIVYQYVTGLNDNGSSATVGIQNFDESDRNEYSCNTNAAPSGRSVCFYHPSAPPTPTNAQFDGRPYVRMASLASGNTINATLPLHIPADASCGAPLRVSYLGTLDDTSYSMRGKSILSTTVGAGGACNVGSCGLTASAKTLPKNSLFQNPNRLGSGSAGFNIPRDGSTQFASVWYTAKADRSPYWYTQGGVWNSLRTQVRTDLTETKRTNFVGFGVTRQSVGEGFVTFLDDSNEYAYIWNLNNEFSGEKALKFVDDVGFVGDSNRTGGWFNPTEDGWGVTVADFFANNTSIRSMLAFIFDADGEPRWMAGSSANGINQPLSASMSYTHCPTCPNFPDFLGTLVNTGTMSMSFQSQTSSTFSSQLTYPTEINGSWTRTNTPMILLTTPFQ